MIWCVEDDESIREIEIYTLESTGYKAKGFCDAKEMFDALKTEKPALILLDVMLPGEDGVSVLRKLKMSPDTLDIPVIMATAKGMEYDKIQCLDLGADDYLVKPFGMMEMVSRIKAVLRRCSSQTLTSELVVEGIVLNPDEHVVTADGQPLQLTYKEFELLKLFMSNPNKAFSRDKLFSSIWGEDFFGETRTVDAHIKTLRQKLGKYGELIKTVRNVGYRLDVKNK